MSVFLFPLGLQQFVRRSCVIHWCIPDLECLAHIWSSVLFVKGIGMNAFPVFSIKKPHNSSQSSEMLCINVMYNCDVENRSQAV